MVLADSFYYQPVQIDTINTRVNADLFAKEGDANGRGMVVQITENGIIKDTTGIELRLQWSHLSVGVSGFTDFEVVDSTKGLYKVKYPTSMLHRGRVEAFIRITDNGILSGTRNLLITVERMVGSDETIEASDDFSALQTALTRLSSLESAIIGKVDTWESDMEATKQLYIDTLAAAEAAYPQELVSLTSQLAETNAQVDLLSRGLGETFATLVALQTAYPTGDTKDHIVAANGHRYFWNDTNWTDGGAYQAIEILDGTVLPEKTSFFVKGTNLFNKNDITSDYYIVYNTGASTAGAGWVTSGYIKINPNASYIIAYARNYAFYDINKTFISGITGISSNVTLTTPANAVYIRFSWPLSSFLLGNQILNAGSTLLAYEDYKVIIPVSYQEKQQIDSIDFKNNLATYVGIGKNLCDKSKSTIGYFVNQTNGTLASSASYNSSEYIAVLANTVYTISWASGVRVAYYNSAKVFISGISGPAMPITTPANTAYIKFSYGVADSPQIELGAYTSYEPYGYKFIKPLPIEKDIKLEFSLPPKVYGLVGQELNIYFDNIINDKDTKYTYDVTCTIGQQYTNFYRVTPIASGSFTLTIEAYIDNVLQASISTTLIVTAATVGTGATKKLNIIGDSTTANGIAVSKLNDNFSADAMDLVTQGSLGTAPNNHDGISGWTAKLFNSVSDGITANPFWNPNTSAFDYAYYIGQKGLTSPDYVVINLGINDVFSYKPWETTLTAQIAAVLARFESMIASIKTYNPAIKIGVAITIPPNYNPDSFGLSYGAGQTRWVYKATNFLWVKSLINQFKNREGELIYLIPIHASIDTRYNFPLDAITPQVRPNARNGNTYLNNPAANAGVHPDYSGYWQIADVYHAWLKSFEV